MINKEKVEELKKLIDEEFEKCNGFGELQDMSNDLIRIILVEKYRFEER